MAYWIDGSFCDDMRILLVDDNPDDLALEKRAIRRAVPEAELLEAHDGQQALHMLIGPEAREDERPALIFLDLKMPRVNGIEVLTQLRQEQSFQRTPIVVLTSSDEEADLDACYRAGVNSYIRKPVEFEEFVDEVGHAARYWCQTNAS